MGWGLSREFRSQWSGAIDVVMSYVNNFSVPVQWAMYTRDNAYADGPTPSQGSRVLIYDCQDLGLRG